MRVLLLHYTPRPRAVRLTTEQHLAALASIAQADVLPYNGVHGAPSWLRHLRFDAVVLHTTLLAMRWNVWFEQWKRRLEWLADVDALKVAFPQDEYNHAHVLDDWLADLGVDVVFSIYGDEQRDLLYPRLAGVARFEQALTGYVDERDVARQAAAVRPHDRRPLDLAYRAQALTPRFGRLGQLKHL